MKTNRKRNIVGIGQLATADLAMGKSDASRMAGCFKIADLGRDKGTQYAPLVLVSERVKPRESDCQQRRKWTRKWNGNKNQDHGPKPKKSKDHLYSIVALSSALMNRSSTIHFSLFILLIWSLICFCSSLSAWWVSVQAWSAFVIKARNFFFCFKAIPAFAISEIRENLRGIGITTITVQSLMVENAFKWHIGKSRVRLQKWQHEWNGIWKSKKKKEKKTVNSQWRVLWRSHSHHFSHSHSYKDLRKRSSRRRRGEGDEEGDEVRRRWWWRRTRESPTSSSAFFPFSLFYTHKTNEKNAILEGISSSGRMKPEETMRVRMEMLLEMTLEMKN